MGKRLLALSLSIYMLFICSCGTQEKSPNITQEKTDVVANENADKEVNSRNEDTQPMQSAEQVQTEDIIPPSVTISNPSFDPVFIGEGVSFQISLSDNENLADVMLDSSYFKIYNQAGEAAEELISFSLDIDHNEDATEWFVNLEDLSGEEGRYYFELLPGAVLDAAGNKNIAINSPSFQLKKEPILFVKEASYEKYYSDFKETYSFEYLYNKRGQILKDKNGEYEYDESGRVIKDPWGEYEYNEFGSCVSKLSYSDDIKTTFDFEYDTNGQVIKQLAYSNGILISEVEYERDPRGKILELKQYKDGELTRETKYEYYSTGILKKQSIHIVGIQDSEIEYWDNGNEKKGVSSYADGTTNLMEYDYNGNVLINQQIIDYGTPSERIVSDVHYDYWDSGIIKSETEETQNDRTEWTYNASGEVIKYVYYLDGAILTWLSYEYDDNGKLYEERTYGSNGNYNVLQRYFYDANGNLIEKYRPGNKGLISGWAYDRYTYSYDSSGNLIEENYYYEMDKLENRYTYEYDESGNKINQKDYDAHNVLIHEYCWDSYGNLIQSRYYKDGILDSYEEFSYMTLREYIAQYLPQ